MNRWISYIHVAMTRRIDLPVAGELFEITRSPKMPTVSNDRFLWSWILAFGSIGVGAAVIPSHSLSAEQPPARNRQWTLEDLSGQLDKISEGRSFQRGRDAFNDALCALCHRVGREGGDMGPDLSNLKKKRLEIVQEILEPSKNIEDKYRTVQVTTTEGAVISGIVVKRDEKSLVLRTRPVGANISKQIPIDQIESEQFLDISTMPDGLLNRLSLEQILDVVAFVEAGGNPDHPLYKQ